MEYNECIYQPSGWNQPCRFVVMRIPKGEVKKDYEQLELFEDSNYKYRVFVTNRIKRPHKVIREYDKRADCENLIGEAKREGIAAMPSSKFSNNYAYFQIVMLAYNIWRSFKMLAAHGLMSDKSQSRNGSPAAKSATGEIVDNTLRIARLKLLLIASKVAKTGNRTKVKYSEHDSRTESLFQFYRYLDRLRGKVRPWLDKNRWFCNHLSFKGFKQAAVSL